MSFFPKKYRISSEQANATLHNIFDACNRTPNTISIWRLAMQQKRITRTYDRLIILTAALLLVTFLAPLALSPAVSLFHGGNRQERVSLVADYLTDGILCLVLTGDDILYEEAYQETAAGLVETPVSYDEIAGKIYFRYYATDTNIYIPVENAPVFHLLLSPK